VCSAPRTTIFFITDRTDLRRISRIAFRRVTNDLLSRFPTAVLPESVLSETIRAIRALREDLRSHQGHASLKAVAQNTHPSKKPPVPGGPLCPGPARRRPFLRFSRSENCSGLDPIVDRVALGAHVAKQPGGEVALAARRNHRDDQLALVLRTLRELQRRPG